MPDVDELSLKTYLETRLNLLIEDTAKAAKAQQAYLDERDRRYQERYEADSRAREALREANEKALVKVETTTEKRFEGVNEFRGQLADQQRTFMPRAEIEVSVTSMKEAIAALTQSLDRIQSERMGIKGGYGYAVGAVGFVLSIVSFGLLLMKALNP